MEKDIKNLKTEKITGKITKGCLALEGGAFRGIYTAGVLDYFMEHNLNISDCYGVSAGGLTGANYLGGNYGRSALLILEHRNNKRYVGLEAYKESGSVVGFEFMFNDLEKEYPLHEENIFNEQRTLTVVATNLKTGRPEYFNNHDGREVFFKALRATASMPLVSRNVKIGSRLYLDGGCVTKLPIRKAIADGHEKIIFIGTRDAGYRRRVNHKLNDLVKVIYHKYPKFIESFTNADLVYNQDCDLIDQLVLEKKVYRITPSKPVSVGRLEKSIKKLSDLYYLGYFDAMANFDEVLKFLKA